MKFINKISCLILLLACVFPALASSADLSVERQVQQSLHRSKALILKIEAGQNAGLSVNSDIAKLKEIAVSIRSGHAQLVERFNAREQVAGNISALAVERHSQMSTEYLAFLDEYLLIIESLPPDTITSLVLDDLKRLLETFLPQRDLPILGSLPYRELALPARIPLTSPTITPAYLGGNSAVTDSDLASTNEAPITLEIAQLAESLHWSPVEIYGWVKNNIKSEWYWGVMKGAEGTLRQKSGNDADQAALLSALLRSAGFPTRYVQGVIEFFPDIETAKNLTGIDDIRELLKFFQKAGIPCEPVIQGGRTANIRIEHIWVESLIPYDNYRGAIIDEHGKSWLGLDTHIKTGGVTENTPSTIPAAVDLAAFREEYLQQVRTETPLEFLKTTIEQSGAVYDDLLLTRSQIPEEHQILPASLQFKQIAVTGEFTEIPAELKHRVRFTAAKGGEILFADTFDVLTVAGKSIAVIFEPSTVEDQEIINSYGGLSNTPAYLVHLRPVLTVDGERALIGINGLPVGDDFTFTVEMISGARSEVIRNTLITGNLAVIGLAAQQVVLPAAIPLTEKNAERLLHEQAMIYIDNWNRAEEELSSLLKLPIIRPLPTVVTLGGVVDVVRLLDVPHGFDWKGVFIDADLRVAETVGPVADAKLFMELSSLQGSILENRIFEDGFGVEAISTAKLLALNNQAQMAVETIDSASIAAVLPTLTLPENIRADIENAVNQGLTVTIPQLETLHNDWLGTGYIKENTATGEAGYMLSGMVAGGMTTWNSHIWPPYIGDILKSVDGEPAVYDPLAAMNIKKIAATDLWTGVVGKKLGVQLQVKVTDKDNNNVAGAEVTYIIKAGGGSLANGTGAVGNQVTVVTDTGGIARVSLILGTDTSDNSTSLWQDGDTYSTQVGTTIIDAKLVTGTYIATPFTAFAFPGPPVTINKTYGDDSYGLLHSWAGPITVAVEDQYGNPVSNRQVTFASKSPVDLTPADCSNPGPAQKALLYRTDDPCFARYPVYGQCGDSTTLTKATSSTGTSAQVVLGGMSNAKYPITATVAGTSLTTTFHKFSTELIDCSDSSDNVDDGLLLYTKAVIDEFGRVIDAGLAGTSVPITAACYFLEQKRDSAGNGTGAYSILTDFDSTVNSKAAHPVFGSWLGLPCDEVPYILPVPTQIDGKDVVDSEYVLIDYVEYDSGGCTHTPQYYNEKEIVAWAFTDNQPMTPMVVNGKVAQGVYKGELPLMSQPGENLFVVECSSERGDGNHHARVSVPKYGVDIALPLTTDSVLVPVDENGYVKNNIKIDFLIKPAEYEASSAYLYIYKEGDEYAANIIPVETSGQGFAELARGIRFDQSANYEVELVLNPGGKAEIKSDRKPMTLITLELDADLNRNGDYEEGEDDPQEHSGLGLIVPVNIDDDDNDKVVDLLDGYDADAGSATPQLFDDSILKYNQDGTTTPVIDDDLIEVKLKGFPTDFAKGKVVLEVVSDSTRIKIWTSQEKGLVNLLLNTEAATTKEFALGSTDYPTINSLPKSIYLEGIAESATVGDVQLLIKYISTDSSETETDRLMISVSILDVVPDYNRDGVIDQSDERKVNKEEPWRFWLNDDADNHAEASGIASDSRVDLPGRDHDRRDVGIYEPSTIYKISNIRDLVDFFPLHLKIHSALKKWSPYDGYKYKLKNVDNALGINIPKPNGEYLIAGEVSSYLEDPEIGKALVAQYGSVNGDVNVITAEGFELPAEFLMIVAENDEYGVVLVEGRELSNSSLVLEVLHNNDIVMTYDFPINIVNVEDMFAHLDLRSLAGGAIDGETDRFITRQNGTIDLTEIDEQPDCMKTLNQSLLWVHGWNVSPEAVRSTFAEVFKRMFHAGLIGNFVGVSWFGDPYAPIIPHFHQSIVNAIATAKEFAKFVNWLSLNNGPVNIFAHSLGNLVVGEAIQNHSLQFNKYFATDSAIALEAYGDITLPASLNVNGVFDDQQRDSGMLMVGTWSEYIAAGQSRLLSSEWHTLFKELDDNRKNLTWRNRLLKVSSEKVYNFYSGTEDVLRSYTGDNIYFDGMGATIDDLAISTWVKQEKFKGRREAWNLADNIGGVSSRFCGWSFNSFWDVTDPESTDYPPTDMTRPPAVAISIKNAELQKDPFFDLPKADLENLVTEVNGITPSDFVNFEISKTGLKSYYKYNEAAQSKVTVSDWLLAEAFPATTLPMGANYNTEFTASRNIDMSGDSSVVGKCCKTSEALWPRLKTYQGAKEWRHSDYKDVSYQHVYKFYKKFTNN